MDEIFLQYSTVVLHLTSLSALVVKRPSPFMKGLLCFLSFALSQSKHYFCHRLKVNLFEMNLLNLNVWSVGLFCFSLVVGAQHQILYQQQPQLSTNATSIQYNSISVNVCAEKAFLWHQANSGSLDHILIDFSASSWRSFELDLSLGGTSTANKFFYDSGCDVTMISKNTAMNGVNSNLLRCHSKLIARVTGVVDGALLFVCFATLFIKPTIKVDLIVHVPAQLDFKLGKNQHQLLGWNYVEASQACIDHEFKQFAIMGGAYTDFVHINNTKLTMTALNMTASDLVPYLQLPLDAVSSAQDMINAGLGNYIMRVSVNRIGIAGFDLM